MLAYAASMPSEIDTSQRRTEIAEATLQLARERGPGAVTIRAVAARMGGSTTVITSFIPSRSALLMNAMTLVREGWNEALDAAIAGRTGLDRLHALIDWTLDTTDYDDAVRRLWNEILAKEDPDSEQWAGIRSDAHQEQAHISEALAQCGPDVPSWLADVLFLIARGYFVSTVEDPEMWANDRALRAVCNMLDDLFPA